ncbi:hypothetical protein ACLKA6_004124 [Drosophila palustris]
MAQTNGRAFGQTPSSSVSRSAKYTRSTELRRVADNEIFHLASLLDMRDCWKKLMRIIPKQLDAQACSSGEPINFREIADQVGYKYTDIHMHQISAERLNSGQSISQIMIDEWKTSGKFNERPTVGVLLQLLIQAEIYSAADYVAVNFLNEPRPARPAVGPAAPIRFDLDSDEIVQQNDHMEVEDIGFQPSTSELYAGGAQAQAGTSKLNMDYFDKHRVRRDKSMPHQLENGASKPVPPPRTRVSSARLSKSATNNETTNTSNSNSTAPNMPILSILNQQHYIPKLSMLNCISTSTSPDAAKTSSNNGSHEASKIIDTNLPDITLLRVESSSCEISGETSDATALSADSTAVHCHDLPSLSTFNLRTGSSVIKAASNEVAVRHDDNSSGTNSLSNDDGHDVDVDVDVDVDDDEADVSLPNLSNSDHQTSNNDSSLTTVTGTSGENSFEITNDSSLASNDEDSNNIPDLSELQQK